MHGYIYSARQSVVGLGYEPCMTTISTALIMGYMGFARQMLALHNSNGGIEYASLLSESHAAALETLFESRGIKESWTERHLIGIVQLFDFPRKDRIIEAIQIMAQSGATYRRDQIILITLTEYYYRWLSERPLAEIDKYLFVRLYNPHLTPACETYAFWRQEN